MSQVFHKSATFQPHASLMSAWCQPDVSNIPAAYHPYVRHMLEKSQPHISQMSATCQPCANLGNHITATWYLYDSHISAKSHPNVTYLPHISHLSATYEPYVSLMSATCHPNACHIPTTCEPHPSKMSAKFWQKFMSATFLPQVTRMSATVINKSATYQQCQSHVSQMWPPVSHTVSAC
jgi:hypothetical protein